MARHDMTPGFGIKLPNLSPIASRDAIVQTARASEQAGLDAVWASDHVVFARSTEHRAERRRFPVPFDTPAVDPLVALSVVAGATERVLLGTSVVVLANRNPVIMAKAWSSLDMLAPGRVVAGVGTGWQREEFDALGVGHRFDRRGSATEEFIEVMRRCWSDPAPAFEGEHYRFDPLHFHPQPPITIPVLLGGASDRGLRRVGRCGDGYHGTNLTPEAAAETIDRISDAADRAGRDPDALWFTTLVELERRPTTRDTDDDAGIHLVGSAAAMAERVAAFAEAGIAHLALRVRALSGSTRPGVGIDLSLERGLDEIEWFAEEVADRDRETRSRP